MKIKIQKFFSFISFPLLGLIIFAVWFIKRYRIEGHQQLRRQFKEISRDRSPLIICSNHLTYLDPVLIIWALRYHFSYMLDYRLFMWNLAAIEYQKHPVFRVVGYLSKCLFIDRNGSKDHHNEILNTARDLVARGEILNIFPEGKRSRTGRFNPEALTHGVGKIVSGLPGCRVLCVYLRGDKDQGHAGFPSAGSHYYMKMKVITPTFEGEGRNAYHQIVSQIGATIAQMEQEYFALLPNEKNVVTGTAPLYT